MSNIGSLVAALLVVNATSTWVQADAVTEWNSYWEEVVFSTAQPVPAHARFGSILHAAVFDAVNGISRRFTTYYITENAPPGAREEAAAVQAAYTVLVALYPAETPRLDAHLADSIARIPGSRGNSQSITRGRSWGEYVARQILVLRSNDGWTAPPPPFFGGSGAGEWRSIAQPGSADGTLPAVFAQNSILAPFAMMTPSQFRPSPPYAATVSAALATAEYAADVNEVKEIGRANSATRTEDETNLAKLWQAVGPVDLNRAARDVLAESGNSLVENARVFALINIATCDSLIASMDSKFAYNFWRPHHAIRLADTDGNPATIADTTWTALILAPRFPEYVSNHASLTAGFMNTLAQLIGDEHTFTLRCPNYPTFTWTFERFSDAADQVKEARIWAGIHYRRSCDQGQELGQTVAAYVLANYLRPVR